MSQHLKSHSLREKAVFEALSLRNRNSDKNDWKMGKFPQMCLNSVWPKHCHWLSPWWKWVWEGFSFLFFVCFCASCCFYVEFFHIHGCGLWTFCKSFQPLKAWNCGVGVGRRFGVSRVLTYSGWRSHIHLKGRRSRLVCWRRAQAPQDVSDTLLAQPEQNQKMKNGIIRKN